jgi:hypothetical protein
MLWLRRRLSGGNGRCERSGYCGLECAAQGLDITCHLGKQQAALKRGQQAAR